MAHLGDATYHVHLASSAPFPLWTYPITIDTLVKPVPHEVIYGLSNRLRLKVQIWHQ